MADEDEAARQGVDRVSTEVDGRAAGPLGPEAADARVLPESDGPRPSAALGFGSDLTSTEASPGPDRPRSVSLAPLWLVTIAGLLILAGAEWYLFTLLPDPGRLASTEAAVADLQARTAALQARPVASDTGALSQRLDAADRDIAALKAQLASLRPAPAAAPGTPADFAPLTAKIAGLDRTVADIRAALPDDFKQTTADLGQRLSALSQKVDGLPKVDLGPLDQRVDALDKRLAPIAAEFEAAKSPARVTTVRQNGSAAETRAAPLAVTAEAVQRAIDTGRPFGEDVKVLASLGADTTLLAPLQAVAETGAPTSKDLRNELAAVRNRIDAQATPAPTGSYLDRLVAGAASVVQVRPVGSVVGDAPPAVLARMDDDLARDDLAAALTAWQKLPNSDQALGRDLVAHLRLRQAAQDAARTIGARAIAAMATDQP